MTTLLVQYLIIALWTTLNFGAKIVLDPTYGSELSGITTTAIGNTASGNAIALQADQKVVAAGTSDATFAVARYSSTGNLDTANFNSPTGYRTTTIGDSSDAVTVAMQSDNKIVAAGSSTSSSVTSIALARYTSAGALDTSNFGNPNGYVTTAVGSNTTSTANKVLVQPSDQKIVVAGLTVDLITSQLNIALARYNTSGSLDTGFGSSGIVVDNIGTHSYAASAVLQTDGKIVIAGLGTNLIGTEQVMVARYTTSGARDTATFGAPFSGSSRDGYVITNIISGMNASAVGLQTQGGNAGKIIVAGYTSGGTIGLLRFGTDGALDTSFGTDSDGGVRTSLGSNAFIQFNAMYINSSNDSIVVTGTVDDQSFVARYTASGALDSTFGVNGINVVDICNGSTDQGLQAVAIDTNSKPTVVGFCDSQFLTARLLSTSTDFVSFVTPVDSSTVSTNQVQVTGTSSRSNTKVRISIDSTPTVTVITDERGNWDAGTTDALSYGDHTFTADLMIDSTVLATSTITVTLHPSLNEITFAPTALFKSTTIVPDFLVTSIFGSPSVPIYGWQIKPSNDVAPETAVLFAQIPKDISPDATDIEVDIHFLVSDQLLNSGSNVRWRIQYNLESDGTTITNGDLVAVSGSDVSVSEPSSPDLKHYKTTITLSSVSGLAAQKFLMLVFDRVAPTGGSEYNKNVMISGIAVRYPH